MKYGRIFTYENRNEAMVGKRYIFRDTLTAIDDPVDGLETIRELERVDKWPWPFKSKGGVAYQFIREVIDEPVMMTYRQLAEWLAKRNGLVMDRNSEVATNSFMYPISIENKQLSGDVLLVRPWDSDEWVKPTVDIYERDCR